MSVWLASYVSRIPSGPTIDIVVAAYESQIA
jgi:hypothetical protein